MQRSNLVHGKYASTDTKLFLAERIDKQLNDPHLRSLEPVVAQVKAIFEKRLEELKRRNDRARGLGPKEFIQAQINRLQKYLELAEKFKSGTLTDADNEWLDSERGAEELTAKDADALYRGIETTSRVVERMVKVEEGFKMTIDFPRMGDLVRALQGEIKQAVRAVMDEKAAEEVQKQLETRFRRMAAIPA